MANFGLEALTVVAPHPPVWAEVRSAVGAGPVLEGARVVGTLEEAIAGCALVGGTTAGTGRRLAEVRDAHAFCAEAWAGGPDVWERSALVFGNEKRGLTRAELERCHGAVRIPTSAAQPSMNLGHAVAVCCYEASRAASAGAAPRARGRLERRASVDEVDEAIAAVARARVTVPELALVRGLLTPRTGIR
jgi:TrmH family RNA methyltransferase